MGFKFVFQRKITKDIRSRLREFAKAVESLTPVTHDVDVLVVPHCGVQSPDGRVGFGVFGDEDGIPRIYLAAGIVNLGESEGDTREDAICCLEETFAHEIVHYEQFRDGRELQERGVGVRSRNLLRKAFERLGRHHLLAKWFRTATIA